MEHYQRMAQINVSKARDFHRQFQKKPSGYTHWDIPQFTPCNAIQQNNCAALQVTQVRDHSWNVFIPDTAIIWPGVTWDEEKILLSTSKLSIWISLSIMVMLMVEGDTERRIKEIKRTPELWLTQGVRNPI